MEEIRHQRRRQTRNLDSQQERRCQSKIRKLKLPEKAASEKKSNKIKKKIETK